MRMHSYLPMEDYFVIFVFPMAVAMIPVVWDVTPCSLVGGYRRFGGPRCLHLQIRKGFKSEVGDRFLQNFAKYRPRDSVSYRKAEILILLWVLRVRQV
jgi:hypothetical protein